MRVTIRGYPDARLWRWPLRLQPVAECRLCGALVVDALNHARWHARARLAARAALTTEQEVAHSG